MNQRRTVYKKDPSEAWCFTVNKNVHNAYELLKQANKHHWIVSIYYQKERYKNGGIHIQGYVVFSRKVDYLFMKKWVAKFEPTTNFANRIGTHKQAKDYATKIATRVPNSTVVIESLQ